MQKNMNRTLNNFVVFNKLLLSNLCNITRNKNPSAQMRGWIKRLFINISFLFS